MREGEQAFKPLNFFLTTIGVLIMDRSWRYTKARSLRTMLLIVFPIVCIPEKNKMDFLLKNRLQFHLISFLVAALTQNDVSPVSMRVTIEQWQRGLQE